MDLKKNFNLLLPKPFWARPKSEFGEHLVAQASSNVLQASLPVTTHCWTENKLAEISSSLRQSELIQKDYIQSKLIKSADLTENGYPTTTTSSHPKHNVIKTPAKSQDKTQDTSENHMMPDHDQVKPRAPRTTRRFGSNWISQSSGDSISNSQLEHLEKRGFPSHMTIYGHKYRRIRTEIQTFGESFLSAFCPDGLRLSHWPAYLQTMIRKEKLLTPPFVPVG